MVGWVSWLRLVLWISGAGLVWCRFDYVVVCGFRAGWVAAGRFAEVGFRFWIVLSGCSDWVVGLS